MNWQHLSAVIWLRWRIRVNQVKRLGTVNAVVTTIIFLLFLVFAAGTFVGTMPLGKYLLGDVRPLVLLLVWDGLVVAFLFCWMIGLITELQRSESLSTDKFLHLPVSLSGVFLVNYLGSLLTLSAVVFLPAMIGLTLGLAAARGFHMMWGWPLIAAFFLMISALTYQFRGWLAALMSNPRRRRTIIVGITIGFVLIAQLPNIINMWMPWHNSTKNLAPKAVPERETELLKRRERNEITAKEYLDQIAALHRESEENDKLEQEQTLTEVDGWARLANRVLPPGWLPLGVATAAEGGFLTPLLGLAGMSLIGVASLWRAYRTTIRYYTGQFTSAGPKKTAATIAAIPKKTRARGSPTLLERRLPRVSEYVSAIATSGFRSLLRAPEAKMMFLSPIILVLVFGSMLFRESMNVQQPFRSLYAVGAVAMTLFGMVQFVGNQFGFDRGGFRVFVLCPAPRRDILIGKNLAMAPFALGMAWVMIILIQIIRPMRFDHVLAMIPQSISMYLIFCLMANWLSIYAPMPISAGSMKPNNPRFAILLLHILFTFALPMALSPTLLPWLAEYLIGVFGNPTAVPVFLIGALVELAGALLLYYALIFVQGDALQRRELALLDVVTKKAE